MLTVKLTSRGHDDPSMPGIHHFSAGTRHLIPGVERSRSQLTVVSSSEQVTAHAKQIPNEAVYRQESLRVSPPPPVSSHK